MKTFLALPAPQSLSLPLCTCQFAAEIGVHHTLFIFFTLYIYVCMCVYACMYMCMSVYMYIGVCMYIVH